MLIVDVFSKLNEPKNNYEGQIHLQHILKFLDYLKIFKIKTILIYFDLIVVLPTLNLLNF